MKKYYFLPLALIALVPKVSLAHCPLCTAGAGALAVTAAYFGVSSIVVGILIGAFALALSLWLAGALKKKYIPYQRQILTVLIFLGTVVPIMPLVREYAPLYVSFLGEYGTTYTINLYIFGVVIGALIMFLAPFLSKGLTKVRGKQIPFQGMGITLVLLVVVSVIVQVLA